MLQVIFSLGVLFILGVVELAVYISPVVAYSPGVAISLYWIHHGVLNLSSLIKILGFETPQKAVNFSSSVTGMTNVKNSSTLMTDHEMTSFEDSRAHDFDTTELTQNELDDEVQEREREV